jgi:hypothetical protein
MKLFIHHFMHFKPKFIIAFNFSHFYFILNIFQLFSEKNLKFCSLNWPLILQIQRHSKGKPVAASSIRTIPLHLKIISIINFLNFRTIKDIRNLVAGCKSSIWHRWTVWDKNNCLGPSKVSRTNWKRPQIVQSSLEESEQVERWV